MHAASLSTPGVHSQLLSLPLKVTSTYSLCSLKEERVPASGSFTALGGGVVQQTLRQAFARWGRPAGWRVDNGSPWVSPDGIPTDLELWLAGLEVALHRNPPRRPQANGIVERSQRTARAWAGPQECDTAAQLPQRLDKNFFVRMTPEQMVHHEENREIVAKIVSKWRRMRFLSES